MARYSIGLEMLDFQIKSNFKDRLANIFAGMRDYTAKEFEDNVGVEAFTAEIKKETGLSVGVTISSPVGPFVMVPDVSKNHVLVREYARNFLSGATAIQMLNDAGDMFTGGVSLKEGKVTGSFTKIDHTLYFSFLLIQDKKYTNEELAAIMLHELGHLFTYYEYINRTVTTNQILESVAKRLSETRELKEVESIITTASKKLKLTDLDAKKLAQSTNRKAVEFVIANHAVAQVKSELGSNIYDVTSWEQLADNYTARYGAGRALVTALDKLYGNYHISKRSTPVFLLFEAIKLLIAAFGAVGVAFGILTGNVAALWLGTKLFIDITIFISVDATPLEYDRPGARMARIRDQLVEMSKLKDLTGDERKRIAQDLEVIDRITKTVKDRRQFFSFIGGMFNKTIAGRYRQENIQREVEQLIANDLFTISNDLKGLQDA